MKAFFVRINAETEDDVQHVYDLLERGQLRGDVVPEQEYSPSLGISLIDHIIFVLGRINTKLDNLGQLRHLFRLNKILGDSFDDLTKAVNQLTEVQRIASWPAMKEYARDMVLNPAEGKVVGVPPIMGPTLADAFKVVIKEAANGNTKE